MFSVPKVFDEDVVPEAPHGESVIDVAESDEAHAPQREARLPVAEHSAQ